MINDDCNYRKGSYSVYLGSVRAFDIQLKTYFVLICSFQKALYPLAIKLSNIKKNYNKELVHCL